MFILDSLMIAGIRWALETTITAAEAEMNDDSVLREQLIETEMRREMGEITDEEFREIEADLLARIREIKHRREGGSGPLAFGGAQPMETTGDSTFQVEASVSGDFYDPAEAPHTTVFEKEPVHSALGRLVETHGAQELEVLDMEPGEASPPVEAIEESVERSTRSNRSTGSKRSARSSRSGSKRSAESKSSAPATRTARTAGTVRTTRTARTARTTRTVRTKK